MTLTRRHLLRASAAMAGAGLLPGLPAQAASGGLRFVFVVNFGGWDVTRALFPAFDLPVVDVEERAQPTNIGGLDLVDHPERPQVRGFFERYASQTALLHGVLVPSVAHMACLRHILTGRISGRSDWPAIMGSEAGSDFALPHLVLSGPSYPGELGGFVTRTGGAGQLEALIDGDIADWSSQPVARTEPFIAEAERRVLRSRLERAQAGALDPHTAAMLDAYGLSLDRTEELKEATQAIRWTTGTGFTDDCLMAAELLGQDLAQSITLTYSSDWDTHALNDIWQNWHWGGLFDGLNALMDRLRNTPGHGVATLADQTVLVVLSEMGRTPGLNAEDGKDHWPYTSAMLSGPGVAGGQQLGGYDSLFYGRTVDPDSGQPSDAGVDLSCDMLGATLLTLAGVDPAPHLPGAQPILGALS